MHSRRSILAAPFALLAAWAVRPFSREQGKGADGTLQRPYPKLYDAIRRAEAGDTVYVGESHVAVNGASGGLTCAFIDVNG